MSDCEHHFEYQGEVTWLARESNPGGSARNRYYASAFYCAKCCGMRMRNERIVGTSFDKHEPGSIVFPDKPESI